MAAVTVDSLIETYFGNKVVKIAQIDIAADSDTWDTGLDVVDGVWVTPNNVSLTEQMGATYSGGTVTFRVSAATNNVRVLAIGDGP